MDRAALAAYLAIELDSLLTEAGIALTDVPDGLAPILDRVAMIAPVTLDAAWFAPLARYVALDRIVSRFATKINVSIRGDSYSDKQMFDHAKVLRDEARAVVAWFIDPVMPGNDQVPVAAPYAVIVEGPQW